MDLSKLVRENIQKLVAYSSARSEFKGKAEVWLDANENPFDTGLNRYPDPLQRQVKANISEIKGVKPANMFLGNGSDEAIDLLIRIFCEPGKDHILTLPPTYGMYQVCADISGVAVRAVRLSPDFQPDVDQILTAANAESKLLFICSPNNPTGNCIGLDSIEELVRKFPGIVVVDEAYIDFAGQASSTSLLDSYANLVVMQTFSKAWGLAGIRLGMAFADDRIIDLFNKVKPPYNVNYLTQEAALDAFKKIGEKHRNVEVILNERKWLEDALPDLPFVKKVFPSDANFLLVKTENPLAIYDFLIDQKIVVRDRSNVVLCEGCLRFTVGTPQENRRLLQALTTYSNALTPNP